MESPESSRGGFMVRFQSSLQKPLAMTKTEQKILSGGASVQVIGWNSLDWTFGMNTLRKTRFVFPAKCVLSPQTSHPEIL